MSAAAHRLRFSKMHGAGNDFVVLDGREGGVPDAVVIARLCDRHFGVGCDQLLTLEIPDRADCVAAYRIWNADGSTARQCGNGARCLAAWLERDGTVREASFQLQSPSGPVACRRLEDGRFEVELGIPDFAPAVIPLATAAAPRYSISGARSQIEFGAVSIGNPHALVEVEDLDEAQLDTPARLLQSHDWFPEGCNVGFAQVLDRQRIALRVVERGVGETLACGSGACAAVAVLTRWGRVSPPVEVRLPGGTLRVAWGGEGSAIALAGPTRFVFEGEWCA
ncbi:MAG TPA: diaminopimelate epimerase [Xanthomonadaceae bacterium]|nr:diaminopimelate epimerase [Xanthomonadaceae bacterium]